MKRILFLTMAVWLLCSGAARAQIAVQVSVTDTKGEPLPGATVMEAGTRNTATTDVNGKTTINVPVNATLEVSFMGFATQRVTATGAIIDVQLEESGVLLDEVVMVGYGARKRESLTGSVASVKADQIVNRPIMNMATALGGVATGVRVTQGTGNPGNEDVAIRIRGTGSFNNSNPLILVDGVPGSMSILNNDDVESISILKDASSAAIYGSRAANGVILVTTKKGRLNEAPKVTFTALWARQQPVTDLKFLSSTADFMELHNIAALNSSPTTAADSRYPAASINEWRAANANPNGIYKHPVTGNEVPNSIAFPNTDWAQYLFQPEFYQRYAVSVSGGSQNTNYLLSAEFQDNPGTLKNTAMQRFNARANVETKIADIIKVGTLTYATKEFKDPGNASITYLFQAWPGMNPMYNGKYGASEDPNTTNKDNLLQMVAANGGQNNSSRINTTWYVNVDLFKGLKLETKFNYNEYIYGSETYSQNLPKYRFRESVDNPIENIGVLSQATTYRRAYTSNAYTADVLLRYNNTFGKHEVGALAGYEQYRTESTGFSAERKGLQDWSITDISSGAEMNSIGGNSNDPKMGYAVISFFGQLNYAYDNKYFVDAVFRSDASSKYAPDHRASFFPSISGAWRLSEENFFEPVKPYINSLKVKASYGTLGNMVGGNYDWQALYSKVNNVFDEQVMNGIIQSSLPNLNLSWEKLATWNFGLEATFLNHRLGLDVDLYSRTTSDMLVAAIMYKTMGTIKAPMVNSAKMTNQGVEVTLKWNDRIGEVKYGVSGNISYNANEVTSFKGALKYEEDPNTLDIWGNPTWRYTNLADVSTGSNTRKVEGQMIDEYFLRSPYKGSGNYYLGDGSVDKNGGPKDGMIRSKADLDWVRDMIAAGHTFGNGAGNTVGSGAANLWYGQMLMADMNGDGKYGNDDDREFIGKSSVPKFVFGLNMYAEWKGVDIHLLWAGRLGSYHYINERAVNGSNLANSGDGLPADAWNMYYFYDPVKANTDPNYDPANDPDARTGNRFPRLLNSSIIPANTFYLYNTSYLKLKSLQIGYTFPKQWLTPAKISKLRVFVSGENLLTFKSSKFPGVDPELGGSLNVYPIAQLFSAGVTLTF